MPRGPRTAPGGVVFHVLNRGNERRELFAKPGDYQAFLGVLAEVQHHQRMRLLAYELMPNHWHLTLRPYDDGDLGRFMQRLTVTHVRRWREHRHTVGWGHLYQGPYKSFPVEEDGHFLTVCRYVERNALRAGLVARAEDWPWSSLAQRLAGLAAGNDDWPELAPWPVEAPENWLARVNRAETAAELERVRLSLRRGRPLGGEAWTTAIAGRLGLMATLRARGRPPKIVALK